MTTTNESSNLDLMRSLAVLFVVFAHLLYFFRETTFHGFSLLEIGRWGVLLFFVHTSLVLMSSLERQQDRMPDSGLAWPFYIRRCFRVFPLSMLVVLAVGIFRIPVWDFQGAFVAAHVSLGGFFANLFLVQNLTHTESMIAVLWSLPYEMQMYLVLPVLYLLARRSRTLLPLLAVWGFAVALMRASARFHSLDPFYYAPCFVPGILAYKLSKLQKPWLPFFLWPCALAVATAAFLHAPTRRGTWLCCLVVGLAIPQFRELSSAWLHQVCRLIARYSYGIYITHLICLWLAFDLLAGLPMVARFAVFTSTVAISSVFFYHTVEAPMISLGNRWVRHLAEQRAIARMSRMDATLSSIESSLNAPSDSSALMVKSSKRDDRAR